MEEGLAENVKNTVILGEVGPKLLKKSSYDIWTFPYTTLISSACHF